MSIVCSCVGLDCQVLDSVGRKFTKVSTSISPAYYTSYHANGRAQNNISSSIASSKVSLTTDKAPPLSASSAGAIYKDIVSFQNTAMVDNKNIVLVLTNLAVRVDRRKQGLATQLLSTCEEYAKVRYITFL